MKETIGSVSKIKTLLTTLRKRVQPPSAPEGMDPMDVLTLAILRSGATLDQGLEALRRMHEEFVDFNEMRVAPPKDIVEVLPKEFPEARAKAEQLTRTLNRVYDQGNALDLEHMSEMGKRELREHLRGALLLQDYSEAYLLNYLFDWRTLPVDERLAAKLKAEGYLSEQAGVAQARTLLEEAIPPRSRREAFELLSRYAAEPVRAPKARRPARRSAGRAAKKPRTRKAKPPVKTTSKSKRKRT